jgi:hypothetical protein
MDPVKRGLVGYGFGGSAFHAPLISSAAADILAAARLGAARHETVRPGAPA